MKYFVEDLQGGSFAEWTKNSPLTLKELRDTFMDYADADDLNICRKELTLDFISETWDVNIIRVKE